MTTSATSDISALEATYDMLASAIDQAGPEKTELFLVKLAMLQAHELGHGETLQRHIATALQDL